MNLRLFVSGLAGFIVGGTSYFVMSGYNGGSSEGVGKILLGFFALAAVACLLVALYACVSEQPDQPTLQAVKK